MDALTSAILASAAVDAGFLLAISGCVFAVVFLAVYGLFNQPVEVHTSYQREAAIMAGHADRRTVFEIGPLLPIMWVLLSLASGLSAVRLKAKVRRDLIASGNPNYYTVNEYIALSLLSGLVVALVMFFGGYVVEQQSNMLAAILSAFVGFLLPVLHLHSKAGKRVRLISKKIPYALDLISLGMGAGATFTEAVRTLVREDPEDEFNRELSQMLTEVDLGKTRNEALLALTERIPLDSLRAIVGAIIQAESLGTPLTDVLKSQANLLRHQRSVRAEKLAATASVRILIPSMVILVSVVVTVFAPIILRWIRGELF